MEEFVVEYGYIAIFIGTFFEGESVLIAGGFFAQSGHLNLVTIITVATIASYVGHTAAFLLALLKGDSFINFLRRFIKIDLTRLNKLVEKYGIFALFISQYIYGFRLLSAAFFGLMRMGPYKYFLLQFISCLTWACLMTFLGYFFGFTIKELIGDIKKYEIPIAIGIVITGFVIWIIKDVKKRRNL
ncbi:MAG: DedA family protein [Nitrospirae bacterium]|nr:DedA family protein [Nitrospirota bacterium]